MRTTAIVLACLSSPGLLDACQGHRWAKEAVVCREHQDAFLAAYRRLRNRPSMLDRYEFFRVTDDCEFLVRTAELPNVSVLDPPRLPSDISKCYQECDPVQCRDHFVILNFGRGILCLEHPQNSEEALLVGREWCGSCDNYINMNGAGAMACRPRGTFRCTTAAHKCQADCSWAYLASRPYFRLCSAIQLIPKRLEPLWLLLTLPTIGMLQVIHRRRRLAARKPTSRAKLRGA